MDGVPWLIGPTFGPKSIIAGMAMTCSEAVGGGATVTWTDIIVDPIAAFEAAATGISFVAGAFPSEIGEDAW
jgi:hypothetical protein